MQGSDANLAGQGVKLSCGDWKLDTTDTSEQQLTVTDLQLYFLSIISTISIISTQVTEIVNHPSYEASTNKNDVAIIKVSGSFTCEQGKLWPACLPSTNVRKPKILDISIQKHFSNWKTVVNIAVVL